MPAPRKKTDLYPGHKIRRDYIFSWFEKPSACRAVESALKETKGKILKKIISPEQYQPKHKRRYRKT